MKVIADFHLHSSYSRATSPQMNLDGLSRGAKQKGLNLLGTGDFTHPIWMEELKKNLRPSQGKGVFNYNGVEFILTTEVSTIFEHDGKIRKVHHILHAPSFEVADQVNESLSKSGNLRSDGRPTFNITAAELVEKVMGVSDEIMITPAHIWTPWFAVFGSKSGFDSVEECYQDQSKHIFSLETGLSSDPAMNWRLSQLDRFALLSNSDSHSPYPWRLGREANVFDLDDVSFSNVIDAIRRKDPKRFVCTIETSPFYGKYHYSGHRNCKVSLSPKEAKKYDNLCPVCRKRLTIGVEQRVEDLADRPEGFVPKESIPFKTLLPLYEIISFVTGESQLYSQKVIAEQNRLIEKFGNELEVLLSSEKAEIEKVTGQKIADAIIMVREGRIKYSAGYDGEYGKPVFDEVEFERLAKQNEARIKEQRSLRDF
jgi:uncharacterized protein (TIGR00375 family)